MFMEINEISLLDKRLLPCYMAFLRYHYEHSYFMLSQHLCTFRFIFHNTSKKINENDKENVLNLVTFFYCGNFKIENITTDDGSTIISKFHNLLGKVSHLNYQMSHHTTRCRLFCDLQDAVHNIRSSCCGREAIIRNNF